MLVRKLSLATALSVPFLLAACSGDDGSAGPAGPTGPAGADGAQGPAGADATQKTISLSLMGRYETAQFDESAAEIVSFHPGSSQAFVVNAQSGQVDVLDASNPYAPTLVKSLNVAADVAGAFDALADASALGAANSVSVFGDFLAVAIEADVKQDTGYVAFYNVDGTFASAVAAGALPDMLAFTPDGSKVVVANEGEPNGDYSVDPEGSITIIDVSGGITGLTASDVTQLTFTALTSADLTGPVRISSKSASIAADLEPEYVAVSSDSKTAFVALQENNAFAEVDLTTNKLVAVKGFGFKNYAVPGNEIDASNKDGAINIRNWPVFGTYMPDGIAVYSFNGANYLLTANEGDGREYLTSEADEAACTAAGGFDFDGGDCFHYLDEIRIKDIADTGATFSDDLLAKLGTGFDDSASLGRLKVIANLGTNACATLATTGQPGEGCVYEDLYSYGARSFTIWNVDTMQPIFDSGSDFEVITANRLGASFNASNDDNEGDDRSDDKGPEPEGIEVATIEGRTYAFIGLERAGGVMVYDISNPETSEFVQYINPRDFTVADVEADLDLVGDLGPEGLHFVSASDSPTGNAMLIVGNEVSGTTAFFDIAIIQ